MVSSRYFWVSLSTLTDIFFFRMCVKLPRGTEARNEPQNGYYYHHHHHNNNCYYYHGYY